MDIQVFDTWVEGSKGTIHFDVFMPKGKTVKDAINSAKEYLKTIRQEKAKITTEECSFCHIQSANPEQEKQIKDKGYFIYKMKGCPS
jgi:hypothetical protein